MTPCDGATGAPVHESTRRGRRAKVVLYNPRAVFYTMPLALMAVASHLDRTRVEVVIVDARLETDAHAALAAALDGALCLGVTVLTGAPLRDALDASRLAKAHHPDLPIVWGGWHPSMFGRECLVEPAITATVQGQGAAITEAVVKDGGEIPQTLDEWAAFDVVGSVGGPWVSPEKFRRVERFKYFQQVAWDRAPAWRRPLQQVARWRCTGDHYAMPVEMWSERLFRRAERLS